MSTIHYSYTGLRKRAMRDAGITAKEKDIYNRKPATGTFECFDGEQFIIARKRGAFVIGIGEKGKALAKVIESLYAGRAEKQGVWWVYHNADWADKCDNGHDDIVKDYMAEAFYL